MSNFQFFDFFKKTKKRYNPQFQSDGRVEDQSLLFRNLNFRFDTDTRCSLVGPNGCGKSTLLKLLLGKLQPSNNADGAIERSRGLRIGYFSQHFHDILNLKSDEEILHRDSEQNSGGREDLRNQAEQEHQVNQTMQELSACEFLLEKFGKKAAAGGSSGATIDLTMQPARAKLGQFGLESEKHLSPTLSALSGGQKARVCFASISLKKPHILVFDEPTNHLDIESVEALIEALNSYQGGIILVSHDARLVRGVSDEVYVIGRGDFSSASDGLGGGGFYSAVDSNRGGDSGLRPMAFNKYVREVLTGIELKAREQHAKLVAREAAQSRKRAARALKMERMVKKTG